MARPYPPGDVITALTRTQRFRTFVTILIAAQVEGDLRAAGPFLVLAPPDEAFDAVPAALLRGLFAPSRVETLVDLAENHVARRARPRSAGPFVSLLGETVVLGRDRRLAPSGARVLSFQKFERGAIAVVDRVLLPDRLRAATAGRSCRTVARREGARPTLEVSPR